MNRSSSIQAAEMAHFAIPAIWDVDHLKRQVLTARTASFPTQICKTYGSYHLVDSGRPRADLPAATLRQIKSYFGYARSVGIECDFLLNAAYDNQDLTPDFVGRLCQVVDAVQPDVVTVASYRLARELARRIASIRLNISTISGIRSPRDLAPVDRLMKEGTRIESICLHNDSTVDRGLPTMLRALHDRGIKAALLVNENCEYHCPLRKAHYRDWTRRLRSDSPDPLLEFCTGNLLRDPSKLLGLAGLIRPEDIGFFVEMGVDVFKIAGRNRSPIWLEAVFRAYSQRRFSGNLVDLLVFTLPRGATARKLFFIRNESIKPAAELWKIPPVEARKREAARLFRRGDLRIEDPGASYRVVGEQIHCLRPGRYLEQLAPPGPKEPLRLQLAQRYGGPLLAEKTVQQIPDR